MSFHVGRWVGTLCIGGAVSAAVTVRAEPPGRVVVAVADFRNTSPHKAWDYLQGALPELLAAELANDRRFRLVERSQMQKVLAELHTGGSALVDESTAQKLGKLVGASYLVLGSFTDLGGDILLTARLVEVGSGQAVFGDTNAAQGQKEVKAAVSLLASHIVNHLSPAGSPVSSGAPRAPQPPRAPKAPASGSPRGSQIPAAAWGAAGAGTLFALGSLLAGQQSERAYARYLAAADPQELDRSERETRRWDSTGNAALGAAIVSGGVAVYLYLRNRGTARAKLASAADATVFVASWRTPVAGCRFLF